MNYLKIYDQLIERAKKRINDGYIEKHHIVPKCKGGTDAAENLVELTAREHFLAHWLLYRIYPEDASVTFAFFMMSNRFKSFSAIAYEESRIAYRKKRLGFKHNDETIKRISEKRKKQGNCWQGRTHSEETKKQMSDSAKNRNMTEDTIAKRNKKMSESALGVKKTESHRENIKKAKLGEKNPMYGKKAKQITCPHCQKTIGVNMAARYHFDKCKSLS
jgi:hypothetical protein